MKTSVIMHRDLNGVTIRQNHKTGYFNANDLLALYNGASNVQKRIEDYSKLKSSREFANQVLSEEFVNNEDSRELEMPSLVQSKRGKHGGTWMHPYVFMDFAMWLSPEFKLTCIKWIYDKLIAVRDDCGNGFKQVNDALFDKNPQTPPFTYANEAKMINKLVFGRPDKDQRNSATEEQLELLAKLQKADIALIEDDYDYYDRYEKLKELMRYL